MNKKEEFVVNGKTYLMVQPCGMLYTQGREYFLLNPYPVLPDWEFVADRFVCVPRKQIDQLDDGSAVYSVARHIVTNAYAIDYCSSMPWEIIEKLDENDLSETEWGEVVIYKLNVEEDIEPQDFNDVHPVRDVNDIIREHEEELEYD